MTSRSHRSVSSRPTASDRRWVRDASAIVVVAVAAVLITRALLGHRYRRKRRINIVIEWFDGQRNGDDESGVSPDNPEKE